MGKVAERANVGSCRKPTSGETGGNDGFVPNPCRSMRLHELAEVGEPIRLNEWRVSGGVRTALNVHKWVIRNGYPAAAPEVNERCTGVLSDNLIAVAQLGSATRLERRRPSDDPVHTVNILTFRFDLLPRGSDRHVEPYRKRISVAHRQHRLAGT